MLDKINTKNIKKASLAFLMTMFVFSPRLRAEILDHATNYIIALAHVLVIGIILALIGISVPSETVSALMMLVVIALFLLSWIPAGLANTALNPNSNDVFPITIRRIAGWLAFLGWLGFIRNEWLTFWFVIVGIFLFFIFATFSYEKSNGIVSHKKSDGIVVTFVVIMTLWTVWIWASPDTNRAFNRYFGSTRDVTVTRADEQSLRNEGSAAVTYAKPNRDVKVIYAVTILKNEEGEEYIYKMFDTLVSLTRQSVLRVYNHKDKIMTYQNQGFVKIQLKKDNGSFVDGKQYWIEADYLGIISPGDLAEEQENQRNNFPAQVHDQSQPQPSSSLSEELSIGSYEYTIKKGEETGWKKIPGNCVYDVMCYADRPLYRVYYNDGTVVDFTDGINKELPRKTLAEFRIVSLTDQKLVIKVMPRKQA